MNVKNNKNKTIQIKYICYNKQAPRVWLKKNEKNRILKTKNIENTIQKILQDH